MGDARRKIATIIAEECFADGASDVQYDIATDSYPPADRHLLAADRVWQAIVAELGITQEMVRELRKAADQLAAYGGYADHNTIMETADAWATLLDASGAEP